VRIRDRNRFNVWLVSGYAHVFVRLAIVIVTLQFNIVLTFTQGLRGANL